MHRPGLRFIPVEGAEPIILGCACAAPGARPFSTAS